MQQHNREITPDDSIKETQLTLFPVVSWYVYRPKIKLEYCSRQKSTRKINRLQFIQLPKEKNNKENNKETQNVE